MVNSALQVCGFIITLVGWMMSVITCALPVWRKNDLEGEVIEAIIKTTGLWVRCTYQATGHWTCNDYDSFFLGLPIPLQGARALTCLAIALGFIAVLVSVLGLDCTTVAADNPRLKARMVIISGVLHVVGGVSLGIAVSWFAANVLSDYNDPIQSAAGGLRYVYGEALFIGWVAMVISILGGAMMCCSSWGGDDDDDDRRPYAYNPPKPKNSAAEYI